MFEVVGYHCNFCSESSFNKMEIEQHEAQCSFNPKNRTCNSCKHFEPNMPNSYGRMVCTKLNLYFQYKIRTDCEEWKLLYE